MNNTDSGDSELRPDGKRKPYQIPLLVGIAGHRDLLPAQEPAIRAELRHLLSALKAANPDVPIRLLCPMAEGADLLAAEVAVDLDIDILALLTFPADICRADLRTSEARQCFDQILARAERLVVPLAAGINHDSLMRSGPDRDRQFQRAGLLLARYSSLLIAIWDGQATTHSAGTARVIDFRRRGIRLSEEAELAPSDLLLSAHDNDLIYDIRCRRVSTSSVSSDPPPPIDVLGFVGSDVADSTIEARRAIPAALRTLLDRTAEFNRDAAAFESEIASTGRPLSVPSPYATPETLRRVDQLFVQADFLGSYFRRCFVRAIKFRYALWAAMAFFLLAFKKMSTGGLGLAIILAVLAILVAGAGLAAWAHRRKWHRKYLDYRALAEALRVDYYWEIAGVRRRFAGEFAHESFLQKQDSDLEWIRAAMRAVSLQAALQPNPPSALGFAQAYAGWVGDDDPLRGSGQLQYYRQRADKMRRRLYIAEKIDRTSLLLGLLIACLFVLDIALSVRGVSLLPTNIRELLLWALALLTVYAAIFEIYLADKADRPMIRQYRYMHRLFAFAARELKSAREEGDKLEILRSLGHACLAEHAQWILAHRDKTIQGLKW